MDLSNISNTELLTILVDNEHTVREIEEEYQSLSAMEEAPAEEILDKVDWNGANKLIAARELARRSAIERAQRKTQILSSTDVYEITEPLLRHEHREHLIVLALDTRKQLIQPPITIAIGHLQGATTTPREIYRPLILAAAQCFIMVHNHPSGDPSPSPDDMNLTDSIAEAGLILGIKLIDHVIIGAGCWESLAIKAGLI